MIFMQDSNSCSIHINTTSCFKIHLSYSVPICTMRTDLFTGSQSSFFLCLPRTRLFFQQLCGSFRKRRTLTLPVHLVHAPRIQWSPSCLFAFVSFCVLFLLILCSLLCVFSDQSLCLNCTLDSHQNLDCLEYSRCVKGVVLG